MSAWIEAFSVERVQLYLSRSWKQKRGRVTEREREREANDLCIPFRHATSSYYRLHLWLKSARIPQITFVGWLAKILSSSPTCFYFERQKHSTRCRVANSVRSTKRISIGTWTSLVEGVANKNVIQFYRVSIEMLRDASVVDNKRVKSSSIEIGCERQEISFWWFVQIAVDSLNRFFRARQLRIWRWCHSKKILISLHEKTLEASTRDKTSLDERVYLFNNKATLVS